MNWTESTTSDDSFAGDLRYSFGIKRTGNGNCFWIQHFHSTLNLTGRAGLVMANSAPNARASAQDIRGEIIRVGDVDVDVVVAIHPNFFFTITLPCTLW